jgi:hypothetical protein
VQDEHPRVRVSEDAVHGVPRPKARKTVCIPESSMGSHPKLMPRFSDRRNPKLLLSQEVARRFP